MSFHLIKNHQFRIGADGDVEDGHFVRFVTIPISFETTETEDGALSQAELDRLKVFLENGRERPKQGQRSRGSEELDSLFKEISLNSSLKVKLAIKFKSDSNTNPDYVTVTEMGNAKVFDRLKTYLNIHGLNLKLNFKIERLRFFCTTVPSYQKIIDHVVSMDTDIDEITSPTGAQLAFSGVFSRPFWHGAYQCEYSGAMSISCFMYPVVSMLDSVVFKRERNRQIRELNKQILDNEIDYNATITTNGNFFNCHKAFLSLNSKVLDRMVHADGNEDARIAMVEMNEMSDAGVRAFLDYMYTRSTTLAEESGVVAMELLNASKKYEMKLLKDVIELTMLTKPHDWFEPDVRMKLLVFTKTYSEGNLLKLKAKVLVIAKFAEVKQTPTFREQYTDNPNGLIELSDYLFQHI